jgi:hypothetical protein
MFATFFFKIKLIVRSFIVLYKRKDISTIKAFLDFIRLHIKNKLSITEYVNYGFDKCNSEFRKTFLPYCKAEEYWEILNPRKYAVLARDKFIGHAFLSKIGVSTAQLYFVYNEEVWGNNKDLILYSVEQVVNTIKKLNIKQFVAKPAADSAHGKGVGVYSVDTIVEFGGTEIKMDDILSCSKMVLFESLIRQTDQLARINKSSVNTIRMMTALYPNQEVKMIAAFIKIGRAGSCVDNAGCGGNVDCAIDIETGELYNALQFNSWEDVIAIEKHPDSGVVLNGLVIEHWDEVKEIVMGWQAQIPYLKTIGWDVALTDEGPVIVEINNWWDTTGQLFLGRGWHKEVKDCYDAWIEYYKNNNV